MLQAHLTLNPALAGLLQQRKGSFATVEALLLEAAALRLRKEPI